MNLESKKVANYKKFFSFIKNLDSTKVFIAVLFVFGALGLVASIAISTEKTQLLRHPEAELVCDLNPVYSCAKIIDSAPSETLGLPNEILGIMMFASLIAIGAAMVSGAKMKKRFWQLFMLGMLFFMASVIRLFYISVYQINAVCILCSAVWLGGWTITVSGYSWLYDQKVISTKKRYGKVMAYVRKNSIGFWLLLIIMYVLLILDHFWYYYGQFFGF